MRSGVSNCIIIIQARSDSSRLPGKVLSDIEGRPMLWHVINRAKKMKRGHVIVATTTRKMDDAIVEIANKAGVKHFRGKTNDVLDRFFKAALKFKADVIVRITSDCPLIDPRESDKVVSKFLNGSYDYVSNDSKTYPNGLDTECFSFDALKKARKEAKLRSEREHVTSYIWENPDKFKIGIVHNRSKKKLNQLKWSVDHQNDLDFVRQVYARLYTKQKIFMMKDVLGLLKNEPNLAKINAKHKRNEGYFISLKND